MSFCHYNVLGRAKLTVGVSDGAERGRVCEASDRVATGLAHKACMGFPLVYCYKLRNI